MPKIQLSDTPRTDRVVNWDTERTLVAQLCRQLERELNSLKLGEFICAKCGLRKDGEGEKGEF